MISDTLPKDVEGWTREIEHRLQLSSGVDEPFGPNIMQVINLTAEMLYANHTTMQDLIDTLVIKTKSLDQIMKERGIE